MDWNNILSTHLNPQQAKGVQETDSPVLILAGAGSGKTRVITYKFAYLASESGISPDRILAVTFTNKAAMEMADRITNNFSLNFKKKPWITTFHSFCARILRREIHHLNYRNHFSILDENDAVSVIRSIVLSDPVFEQYIGNYNYIREYISRKKSAGLLPDKLSDKDALTGDQEILHSRIYSHYENQLMKNSCLDFDDLLFKTYILFNTISDILSNWQSRFDYILIDEFQDTNPIQFKIIKQLLGERQCITVVGDDDQSIYSFRGADVSNILDFQKEIANAEIIKLEQNYRSSIEILGTANRVVANNKKRLEKSLWSEISSGIHPEIKGFIDDESEANLCAKSIADLLENGFTPSQIAIFYRTNNQSRLFEHALSTNKIPFSVVSSHRFYDYAEIKDLICYLRFIVNPDDSIALKRIINVPKRGIGKKTFEKLTRLIESYESDVKSALTELHKSSNKNVKKGINELLDLINTYNSREINGKVLLEKIIERINYFDYLCHTYSDFDERKSRVYDLLDEIGKFWTMNENATLDEYLSYASLVSAVDGMEDSEKVSLMTVHNAKGLEFDAVYVTGLEEGLFPHIISQGNDDQIEEERRLFYVAMTRAKSRLIISFARIRTLMGQRMEREPSRFLSEIDNEIVSSLKHEFYQIEKSRIEEEFLLKRDKIKQMFSQMNSSKKKEKSKPLEYSEIEIGQKVRYPPEGTGVVISKTNRNSISTVLIDFSNGRKKRFILKYTDLYNVE